MLLGLGINARQGEDRDSGLHAREPGPRQRESPRTSHREYSEVEP